MFNFLRDYKITEVNETKDFHITVIKKPGIKSRVSNDLLMTTSEQKLVEIAKTNDLLNLEIDTIFGIEINSKNSILNSDALGELFSYQLP